MNIKITTLALIIALLATPTVIAAPGGGKKKDYDTILEGEILYKSTH